MLLVIVLVLNLLSLVGIIVLAPRWGYRISDFLLLWVFSGFFALLALLTSGKAVSPAAGAPRFGARRARA